MGELSAPQLTFFAILVVTFALLVTEWLRNDVVAVLVILALAASRLLTPAEALAGFASEPAIVVAAIFVLSAALHETGLSETLGRWIGRLAGAGLTRANAVIMLSVAALSAFTHHVTTTAVMLPVVMTLARDKRLAPSQLLMPLSFAASLGTTITIIGAPAFLIASDILKKAGRPGLGIFSIAPIGIALSLAGAAFIVLVGRWLLPSRAGADAGADRFRLDDYFTELTILEDSPFRDKTIRDVEADERYGVKVVGLVHHGRRVATDAARQLGPGDVLLVRATPEHIVAIREDRGVELHPIAQYEENGAARVAGEEAEAAARLVQAVVAPTSDLIGRSIGETDFRRRYGAIVVSLWRREGWLQQELAQIKLRAGDVLVLQGESEGLERVAADPGFLMMVPFHAQPPTSRRKAWLAAAIMLATIVVATLDAPLHLVALGGAAAMLLTGCIRANRAYRAIDPRIYVFIAGAIPLGTAMQKSGSADVLARWMQAALGDWSPTLVLLVVFGVVAVLTQFMSDSATTALFGPVAIALAKALGHPPEAYVVTVAMASVAAFLTPIGHHGNLLIYGPGGYRFADFVRVGTPLTVIVAIVVVVLARLLWGA